MKIFIYVLFVIALICTYHADKHKLSNQTEQVFMASAGAYEDVLEVENVGDRDSWTRKRTLVVVTTTGVLFIVITLAYLITFKKHNTLPN